MKKILSVFICILIAMAGIEANAADLNELGAAFSITPIAKNSYIGKLKIKITLPSATQNSTLMMVFYKNGKAEKITKFNASAATSFSNSFNTYNNFTPDEIKLFLWESGRLVPLSMSQSALTDEVILSANSEVLDLLDMVDNTTNHIRQFLVPANFSEDVKIASFLADIDTCASRVIEEGLGEKHLLTYEYFMEAFKTELESIKPLMNDKAVKDRLFVIYDSYVSETYIPIIEDMLGFFNISINSQ